MRKYAASLGAVVLPVFIVILSAACGSSAGGSDYGGGSGGDSTAPVTSVDTDTGDVSKGDIISFSCSDNSSGCKETYLSRELSTEPAQFIKAWDVNASGSSTSFTVEISGGYTVGEIYDYQFYSIDNSGNTENTNSRVYTIN